MSSENIRNIAIIAHVDHGKTTLVDHMLKQAGTFRSNESTSDRMMDSGDLEKERGITIQAKNTAILYKDYKINIVDTPGHADFGGEVERILSMVDGCCLLVDAAEGPLPQTRFVLTKALAQGLKVIVVINKIDRGDARPEEVLNEIFDLFVDLDATEEQCDFTVVYAIGREGLAFESLTDRSSKDLEPLFQKIVNLVPPPKVDAKGKLQLLVANTLYSDYLGKMGVGKVVSGSIKVGNQAAIVTVDAIGKQISKNFRVQSLITYNGLKMVNADEVIAGDIAVLAGIEEIGIGDSIVGVADATVASADKWDPISLALPRIKVEEPTLQMEWRVNDSPYAGREGEHVTSRKIRDRLIRECQTNVALRFKETDSPDRFILLGRGELQMGVLAEQLRREGFEFALGQPLILFKDVNGEKYEPMEHAVLDVPEFASGAITQMFQTRKGMLQNIINRGSGRVRLEFLIPSRGIIGLRSKFMTETKGEGLFNFISAGYEPYKGDITHRINGALIADRMGDTTNYSLEDIQARGILFVPERLKVYEGMVIGEYNRVQDLWVNPTKAKQLTNFRTVNKDDAIVLVPPKLVTIEGGLEWINETELLEVTPKNIRIRKKVLAKNQQPK